MAVHTSTVRWRRNGADFLDEKYSRAHEWAFDGGAVVPASSSPHVVPLPYSTAAAVDPEEAFVLFAGAGTPAPEAVRALHHQAHDACFIASSVRTEVVCEPMLD